MFVNMQWELEYCPNFSDNVQNLHMTGEAELWTFKYFKPSTFIITVQEYILNLRIEKAQVKYSIFAIYPFNKFCFLFEIIQICIFNERNKLICILPNMVKRQFWSIFFIFFNNLKWLNAQTGLLKVVLTQDSGNES